MRMKDEDLVHQTLSGEGIAFSKLVERHWEEVCSFVEGILGNRQDAEEVTQDAFLKAYFKLETLRNPSSFLPWLKKIARNIALDRMERLKREGEKLLLSELKHDQLSLPPVDEELLRREMVKEIIAAIEELPPLEREILKERFLRGISYEELCRRFNLSYSAITSRVHRAKRRVREKVMERLKALITAPWARVIEMMGGVGMKLSTKLALTGIGLMVVCGSWVWLAHNPHNLGERPREIREERAEETAYTADLKGSSPRESAEERPSPEWIDQWLDSLLTEIESEGEEGYEEGRPTELEEAGQSGGEGENQENQELPPELLRKAELYAELAEILPQLKRLYDEEKELLVNPKKVIEGGEIGKLIIGTSAGHHHREEIREDGYRKVRISVSPDQNPHDELRRISERKMELIRRIEELFPSYVSFRADDPHLGVDYKGIAEYLGKELPWDGNTDYFSAQDYTGGPAAPF